MSRVFPEFNCCSLMEAIRFEMSSIAMRRGNTSSRKNA